MSTGFETLDVLEPWLIAALKDAVITTELVNKVVNGQTSEDVYPPYLLCSHVSSRDIRGVGTIRIDTDSIYTIKAIHTGNSYVPGRAVMRAVETALDGKLITTPTGSISCIRESMFNYPETIDGVQYMHVGGNYRIRAASI